MYVFLVTQLARQGLFTSLLGKVSTERRNHQWPLLAKLWTARCHVLWAPLAKASLKVSLFWSLPLHLVGEEGISDLGYCQTHDAWLDKWDWQQFISHIHSHRRGRGDHTIVALEDRGNKQGLWEASFILQSGREMKPIRLNTGWSAADGWWGTIWVDSLSHWVGGRETYG